MGDIVIDIPLSPPPTSRATEHEEEEEETQVEEEISLGQLKRKFLRLASISEDEEEGYSSVEASPPLSPVEIINISSDTHHHHQNSLLGN